MASNHLCHSSSEKKEDYHFYCPQLHRHHGGSVRTGPTRKPRQHRQHQQQPIPRPRLRRPADRQLTEPLRRRRRPQPPPLHQLQPRHQHLQHAIPPLLRLQHRRHALLPLDAVHRPDERVALLRGAPQLSPDPDVAAGLAATRVVPGVRGGRSLLHLVPPRRPGEGVGRRPARLQRPVPDPPALRLSGHPVSLLSLPLRYLEGAEDSHAEAPRQECGGGRECEEVWAQAVDEEGVSVDGGGGGFVRGCGGDWTDCEWVLVPDDGGE